MKTIKRNILLIVAVLFVVVPLAVWAEFSSSSPLPLYQKNGFTAHVTKESLKYNDGDGGRPLTFANGAFWVVRNVPFSINWNADAVLADGDNPGDRGSSGITCLKDWEVSTRSAGPSQGVLTGNRTFHMTCAGLGGGVIVKIPVKVGTIDLTIPTAPSLSGLNLDPRATNTFFTGDNATFTVGIKNVGNVATYKPFRVQVEQGKRASTDTSDPSQSGMFNQALPVKEASIPVLDAGKTTTVSLDKYDNSGSVEASMSYYYRVCVDPGNVIPESNPDGTADTNNSNCKIIGPYKFVTP